MGCQSEVDVGDNLVFSITTHDPDTGVLTDADTDPTYRIYEDETMVPILTGTMVQLDNVNTTGFYTELIACTVANGFENGRSYTVYIEATVDADTGGICYGFRATTTPTVFPAGAVEFTYTVTSAATGLPIEGVEVWITTDAAGANRVWKGDTDVFGVARDVNEDKPWLDVGDYFCWSQKGGYTFSNPDLESVA